MFLIILVLPAVALGSGFEDTQLLYISLIPYFAVFFLIVIVLHKTVSAMDAKKPQH